MWVGASLEKQGTQMHTLSLSLSLLLIFSLSLVKRTRCYISAFTSQQKSKVESFVIAFTSEVFAAALVRCVLFRN